MVYFLFLMVASFFLVISSITNKDYIGYEMGAGWGGFSLLLYLFVYDSWNIKKKLFKCFQKNQNKTVIQ